MQLSRVSVCLEHLYKMAHSRPKTKNKPQKQRNSYRRKARNKPSGLEPFVLVEAGSAVHITRCTRVAVGIPVGSIQKDKAAPICVTQVITNM